MVAEVDAVTGLVATEKVALADPAGTVTLAGTDATDGLLLVSVTVKPPAGAEPDSVTVPVEGFPPTTVEGLRETDDNETVTAGLTTRVAVLVVPP